MPPVVPSAIVLVTFRSIGPQNDPCAATAYGAPPVRVAFLMVLLHAHTSLKPGPVVRTTTVSIVPW